MVKEKEMIQCCKNCVFYQPNFNAEHYCGEKRKEIKSRQLEKPNKCKSFVADVYQEE